MTRIEQMVALQLSGIGKKGKIILKKVGSSGILAG
jgi:hypothetical protein